MRSVLALLAFGGIALVVQGVAGNHLPTAAVPNLSLLVMVAIGLSLPTARGLPLAAGLGYATDLLSGALLGQHALLRMLACAAARLANRRLDLRRGLPLAAFAAVLTLADAAGLALLNRAVGGRAVLDLSMLPLLGGQVLVNAVAAPLVVGLAGTLLRWVTPEESARRLVRLEPRRRSV
jgi:rod shape-determining protein MreD